MSAAPGVRREIFELMVSALWREVSERQAESYCVAVTCCDGFSALLGANPGLRLVAACGTPLPPGGAGPLVALYTGQATRWPSPDGGRGNNQPRMTYGQQDVAP